MPAQSSTVFATDSLKVDEYEIMLRRNHLPGARSVILIHGIGVSGKYYRRLAHQLAHHYSVMALDLPGYGETTKPPQALDLQQQAEVVAGYIKREGYTRPVLIGQSMGCQIVARLAAMSELDIDKLILISPTVNIAERSAPMQLLRLMQDVLREPLRLNLTILVDYLKFGPVRYLITQRYMIADQIERVLADSSLPTLLIRGTKDKIVPAQWVEYLRTYLRSADVVSINGAPHNLQYTHPKEAAAACVEFIQK